MVLEGIEKVERNVLPVLNNLLENREMHLEDGRLLIPAARLEIVFLTVPFQALVRINSPTPLLFPINLKNKRMRGGLFFVFSLGKVRLVYIGYRVAL